MTDINQQCPCCSSLDTFKSDNWWLCVACNQRWHEEEIAAGHRIDTPPNATTAPYRHDLPKDGAKVHDEGKEAVKSSRERFEAIPGIAFRIARSKLEYHDDCNFYITPEWTSQCCDDVDYVNNFRDGWQHQQAVVDALTLSSNTFHDAYINANNKMLILKQENDELSGRNYSREVDFYKSLNAAEQEIYNRAYQWNSISHKRTCDKIIDDLNSLIDAEKAKSEELQKRVEAVESTLMALRDKAGEKFDAACAEQDSEGGDYWSGQFHALDTALHSLGFKDSYDEAGLRHETP